MTAIGYLRRDESMSENETKNNVLDNDTSDSYKSASVLKDEVITSDNAAPHTQEKKKKKMPKTVIICAAALAAFFIILWLVTPAFSSNKTLPGLVLMPNEIDLGNMSKEQVLMTITRAYENHSIFDDETVTIVGEDTEQTIYLKDILTDINVEGTADKAFEYGKHNIFKTVKSRFAKSRIYPVVRADAIELDLKVLSLFERKDNAFKEHDVSVTPDGIVITTGNAGYKVDLDKVRADILDIVSSFKPDKKVKVEYEMVQPRNIDYNYLHQLVYQQPKDATYSISGNNIEFVDHVVGRDVDKNVVSEMLHHMPPAGESITIPVVETMPEITVQKLKNSLFRDVLSTYTTKYNAGQTARSANVALAAKHINSTVLDVGQVFSYNEVVGPRTAARGFLNAPVYSNNTTVNGIGGGICQVSTTLYDAALYADLEIVKRTNHSMPVSYVPLGQDATVVDGAVDFQFKNNTNYPIKILASAQGGVLKIDILGTNANKGKTIKLENVTISSTEPSVKEIPDSSLDEGKRVVEVSGKRGYVVETYKCVYQDGNLVERKYLNKSKYNMVPQQVRVGTKPVAVSTPPVQTSPAQTSPAQTPPEQTPSEQTSSEQTPPDSISLDEAE